MSGHRGTRLLESITHQVDADLRLEILVRADRARRTRNIAFGVFVFLLVAVGVLILSSSGRSEVEPVDTLSSANLFLVLPENTMQESVDGCRGRAAYDFLEAGAELELVDPTGDPGGVVVPVVLPEGELESGQRELAWLPERGLTGACVFAWTDPNVGPEDFDGLSLFPLIPTAHDVVESGGGTALAWTVDDRLQGLEADAPTPKDLASRQDPRATVSVGGGGAVRFNYGTECDRTQVFVGFGGGTVGGLDGSGGSDWSDVSVEYVTYESCELTARFIGYTPVRGVNDPLVGARVGPTEVVVFDPTGRSREQKSVVVEVEWLGESPIESDVRHDGAFHQWGWLVHPTVTGRVTVDGVDLGGPDFVRDAELGYRIAIDLDGDEFSGIDTQWPVKG
jgi:hypothetical protein